MTRQTHNLIQGSEEWKRHRAKHLNASECAAMLGISPYMSRGDLLRQKHAGITPQVDSGTQRRFDDGHRYENQARPWAEEEVGSELFPVSMSHEVQGLSLAASLDGLSMIGDKCWEHKTLNAAIKESAKHSEIPEYIRVQMEHQLIVSGADRCLFTASNGDKETAINLWYEGQPEVQQRILDGWKQFQKDLESYEPPEESEPEVVGHNMESLPALNIQVEAKVLATNIDQYKAHAIEVFDSINTDLQTDQDFADAEKAVKFCKEVEERLAAAKDYALSQAEDLYKALTDMDDVSESARQKRLALDKLVKQRKEARRSEIQQQAVDALREHYQTINDTLSHDIELCCPDGFRSGVGQAMKGKRTIQSLLDAADQALTDAKLAANSEADTIRANITAFDDLAGDSKHLFADIRNLVGKQPDDFAAAIKLRISEHQAEQQRKADAERKLAEQEAERKAQREAQEAEAANQRKEQVDQSDAKSEVEQVHSPSPGEPGYASPTADSEELITLGKINEALAPITISAGGLAELGIEPHSTNGASKLYPKSQVPTICQAIARHCSKLIAKY